MENKYMPAFPGTMAECNGGITEIMDFNPCSVGLSKLEFFACNAPVDIPGWFTYNKPEKNIPKTPDFNDIANEEDREMCRQWLHDPIFDLPNHLQWFSDKSKEASDQYSDYVKRDCAARYFQWRRYYAEQLLSELSKPQP